MLKPQRKITRKEIKIDPLLSTLDKIESGFENNKKTVANVGVFLILAFVGAYVLYNNSKKSEIDSSSAFGIAMIAYSNSDFENAKFQFETILSNFSGTDGSGMANYFLGKIAFGNDNYNEAESYLNAYLNSASEPLMACGAIKILHSISSKNENHNKSLKILKKGDGFNLSNGSKLDIQILKAVTNIRSGDFKNARKILDRILKLKELPLNIRQKVDELSGMI